MVRDKEGEMSELVYYTQLNLPYAFQDMLETILRMLAVIVALHATLETSVPMKKVVLRWGGVVIITYMILVLLTALQYAAYYDIYAQQINANEFLYAVFWLIDVVLQLFVVGAICFGAIGIYTEKRRKTFFCASLASLFADLLSSVIVDVVYLSVFRETGAEGLWIKDPLKFGFIFIITYAVILTVYVKKTEPLLAEILKNPDLPLQKFIATPVISLFCYSVLSKILTGAGVNLYNPEMFLLGVLVYLAVAGMFIVMYKDLFLSMQVSGELAKTEAEIGVAETIQKNILPNTFPAFPERDEFDIYATMIPCLGVGGDFYDFFLVDKDHLAIVIADVSGKGIPAALFMMSARTLINTYTNSGISPKDVLYNVNNQLCKGNDTGMFVTVFIGILEISTGEFTYANAGHNQPLISMDGVHYEFLESEIHLVMGAMEDIPYSEEKRQLKEGSIIYLYTDGVTEALNEEKEIDSDERLLEFMNRQNGGIALRRKGRCRLCYPPQAENPAKQDSFLIA